MLPPCTSPEKTHVKQFSRAPHLVEVLARGTACRQVGPHAGQAAQQVLQGAAAGHGQAMGVVGKADQAQRAACRKREEGSGGWSAGKQQRAESSMSGAVLGWHHGRNKAQHSACEGGSHSKAQKKACLPHPACCVRKQDTTRAAALQAANVAVSSSHAMMQPCTARTICERVGPRRRVVLPAGPAVVGVDRLQQRLQPTHKGRRQVPAAARMRGQGRAESM